MSDIDPKNPENEDETDIIGSLSISFGIDKKTILGPSRRKEVVEARDIIVYLLREFGKLSFPSIGHLLGKRDHATALHSYRKVKRKVEEEKKIRPDLFDLARKVQFIVNRRMEIEKGLFLKQQDFTKERMYALIEKGKSMKFREISSRNMKVLELYREGLTLENTGKVFKVTRERIRQIVADVVEQMAINEAVTKGIVIDMKIFAEEERRKRDNAKEAKHPEIPREKREKRWSLYYASCRSCGTTSFPHVRNGLCEKCAGSYRASRRIIIINRHTNKCDNCGISVEEAKRSYGRDFYITKNDCVLCRKCFLSGTGQKLSTFKRKT